MNVIIPTLVAVQFFLKNREAKRLSKETIRWYRGILNKFAKHFPNLPDKPEQIELFITAQTAGDERVHGYWRALKTFYGFLHKRYQIDNVIELTEPPKRKPKKPRPITPEELEQLLSYPHDTKIKAALLFLIDTGARIGELYSLTPSFISETPYGYIARIMGKTGARLIPISVETYQALIQALPFPYGLYRLRRLISKAFDDAHVQGSSINLRHTFGTYWEGDELTLKHIMGHAHLSTTQIYRALRIKSISEQHRKFTPLRFVFGRTKLMEI